VVDRDEDDDDLWLLQALSKMLNSAKRDLSAHKDSAPRLLDTDGSETRVFQSIYASRIAFLFRDHCRTDRDAYDALCEPLIPAKTKYRREVLAVLLDWFGRGAMCRDQELKFKTAFATIHRYRRIGLHAVIKTLSNNIDMPRTVPTWFADNFSYFDQAVAAVDGVHVPVIVATKDGERFRNRKAWPSTNVLIASEWEMSIGFTYPGAEGAAHDSMVLARSELLQDIREHRYVIADAGYARQPQVLTPYRGVRYHLKELTAEAGQHKTAKELYTLRHAKARNVVERVNGMLKRRFKILRVPQLSVSVSW